jgi:hypothetical protein
MSSERLRSEEAAPESDPYAHEADNFASDVMAK